MNTIKYESYPDYFLKHEIDRILTGAKLIPEVYLFCKFLWRTGMRVAEALDFRPEDINMEEQTINIRTKKRKTSHEREVPVSPEFLAELVAFIKSRTILKDMRVFAFTSRTAFNYVKRACQHANLEDKRAHPSTFRHSYAVHCLSNGISIDTVNEFLGNRDIKKTMVYLKLLNQDEMKFEQIIW